MSEYNPIIKKAVVVSTTIHTENFITIKVGGKDFNFVNQNILYSDQASPVNLMEVPRLFELEGEGRD